MGLRRESIEISSGSGIITGRLETGGFSAVIADIDGAATAAFAKAATRTTFATLDASTSDSTLTVVSTSGWPSTGTIHVGTECIGYSGTTSTTFTGLTRGKWNTIPQAHFSALDTEQSRRTEVTDEPITIEGRRVYLFAYGDGDDLQGNGTQVFIGVVSRDAKLSSASEWSLTIDGLSRILDADLSGPDEGAISPRGIYYPWSAPLRITLRQRTTAAVTGAFDGTRNASLLFTGFYETQDAFCSALTAAIAGVTSGWETRYSAISQGDAGWYLSVRIGATARWPHVVCASEIDDVFSTETADAWTNDGFTPFTLPTVVANTTYRILPRDNYIPSGGTRVSSRYVLAPRAVPRGFINLSMLDGATDPSVSSTWPENRIYLQGADSVATATAIFWNDGLVSADLIPSGASASGGYVQAQSSIADAFPFAGVGSVAFSFSRRLFSVSSGYGLADVITWLGANSASICNLGGTPLLQTSDFDPGYVSQIVSAHRGKQLATRRNFWAPKKVKFIDWLAEECKLIGVFPALNASGQIKFVPIKLRAGTEAASAVVDASTQLTSVGWPGWERNPMGTVNAITFKTGYNVMEDKHTGTTYSFRDVTAYSRSKIPRVVEIAPKSTEAFGIDYNPFNDLTELASSVLGVFGRPYRVATINVPWSLYGITAGDLVTLTSAQLPNDAGERGVIEQQGIVLSKAFRANEAHGTIELLLHGQNIAGYAPFSRITAASGGGTTWTLTLGSSTIPGWVDASAFNVGDKVRAMRYDSTTTANDRAGTITSKTSTTVSVTFASSWTFSGVNHLTFDVSTAIATTSAQARWAFVARSTALINHSGGNSPARTFSP